MIGWMIRSALLCAGVMALFATVGAAEEDTGHTWDRETLNMFARLPVQDGGRIKPLDTYATFTLMQIHGRRTCTNLDGERISAVAWLLDCLFYPELAGQYPVFRVENSEAITSIGLQPKRKRDYYSYTELLPARGTMLMMGGQFADKEAWQRTPVEKEIMTLAINLRIFETITAYTGFTRERIDVTASALLAELFPGQEKVRLSEALRKAPEILSAYMDMHRNPETESAEQDALMAFFRQLEGAANNATALALFPPPPASDRTEWLTPADLAMIAFSRTPVMMSQVNLLAQFETLVDSVGDDAAFQRQAQEFTGTVVGIATSRGEYKKIPLEVTFYRLKLFQRALILYIVSFLVVACLWMRPQSRVLNIGAFAAVSLPTGMLILGIILRSVIRGRPPVTSAYETILFVVMVAVMVALFMEWANRKGLAISMGAILGVLGMFFANRYEAGYGGDTMPVLVAVLDTNFWLALHVTTIAIGYGAGFLASGLAHVFIFGQLIGFRRNTPVFYRDLTRMVYGALCFSFVFVCLGTVLGGIWANESWGRFWGWDPKENGALMICLWQLTIMHARLDGILKQHGINIAAVIGGIIIAFCWFGVNMLGVGLHSYGFTSGGYSALVNFYMAQTVVVVLGCIVWFRKRNTEAELLR